MRNNRIFDRVPPESIQNPGNEDYRDSNNPDRVSLSSWSGHFLRPENKTYIPFWWRAFRYIELVVQTKDIPLEIQSFTSIASSYPFITKADFQTHGSEGGKYDKILEIGERTIRCCAHESFMDCPYYEEKAILKGIKGFRHLFLMQILEIPPWEKMLSNNFRGL